MAGGSRFDRHEPPHYRRQRVPIDDASSREARGRCSQVSAGKSRSRLCRCKPDGVLYQGQRAVPGAAEALRSLRRHNVRYVFLTNGGGKHETAKVKSLSQCLGLEPGEDLIHNRVIQSHTPMRGWDDALKEQATILITGANPDVARKVALDYGFNKVVTPADIIAANDKVYPFDGLRSSLHSHVQPLPDGKQVSSSIDPYGRDIPPGTLKIDKIFVWNDPRDWSLDIQVIYDLLVSHQGYYGTVSAKNGDRSLPNAGWQQDGQPELWMSNLDLFWKTEWPVNRYGTGAFLEALRGVWAASTGGAQLRYEALGKPLRRTYDYAHDRLLHHAPAEAESEAETGGRGARRRALRRVYMIGDNPESDVRGANEFRPEDGAEWVSILVRTGVWRPTAGEREPRHRPVVIVDDVADAVVWALQNEGVPATRAWLTSGGQR
ncbi:Uncharacterized protein ESCO_004101 [Escovopsis weberi]|uniref:CDP-alcohol phosphatidyltransferase class-I family protein n=1 Tax=Escovopsis weberi TaxID=150374 RepID=A0A0M8MXI8_ESCWE|nr:Uncharacterized protein ESCO_004101 [Escovopsis weberi]